MEGPGAIPERVLGRIRVAVYPDPEALGRGAAERFTALAGDAVARKGRFAVAMSGGSAPRLFHSLLSREPYVRRIDWARLHLFIVDERRVPFNDPRSNYGAVRADFLSKVPLPPAHVHPMPAEDEDPDAAGRRYEEEIRSLLRPPAGTPPSFDLILLGMGEDGHTASLFPGSPALREERRWVVESKDPAGLSRLTLTLPVLNGAERVIFLVSGRNKIPVFQRLLSNGPAAQNIPAARVWPKSGPPLWLVTRELTGDVDDV